MAEESRSLEQEIQAFNELGTEELGRWIRMHVLRVEPSRHDISTRRRRRHIAPRSVEVTKDDARKLIEILQHGLDLNLPGTIGFTLYGREEL